MKIRITITVLSFLLAFSLNAQTQLVSKKGVSILPEQGEYMVGINANPFFTYFGNMFNGNLGNTSPSFGFTANNPMSIYGKYMVDEHTAYRGVFRLGFTNHKDKEYSVKDGQTPPIDLENTVEDAKKVSQSNITLGVGLEKRRGKGRLQGIYGGQVLFNIATAKKTYEYGNSYSTTNTSPTRTDFGTNKVGSSWITSSKKGFSFGLSLQGFVGAEYFFAPKMSISGELYYGLGYSFVGDGVVESEYWDSTGSTVKTHTLTTGGERFFGFDTSVAGAINLNFYF